MTFADLYIKLVADATDKYPNSEIFKEYDSLYNMAHLNVSEVFIELDMIDYEGDTNFKWVDYVDDCITDEVLEYVIKGFEDYAEAIKDREI